jgi:hypothetical protein
MRRAPPSEGRARTARVTGPGVCLQASIAKRLPGKKIAHSLQSLSGRRTANDTRCAWPLAHLLALSRGKALTDDLPPVGTSSFVSMDCFRSNCRFDDFAVHETAITFHKCKR